jgi:hypothetical protein
MNTSAASRSGGLQTAVWLFDAWAIENRPSLMLNMLA